jgi:hypothetical protein
MILGCDAHSRSQRRVPADAESAGYPLTARIELIPDDPQAEAQTALISGEYPY